MRNKGQEFRRREISSCCALFIVLLCAEELMQIFLIH